MQTEMKQWSDLSKNALESAQKFVSLNKDLLMGLAKQQMDMINLCMESGVKQMQTVSSLRSMQDVVCAGNSLVEDFNKKLMDNARVTSEILTDTKDQLACLLENGLKTATCCNPLSKYLQ
jgi:phasin family protein